MKTSLNSSSETKGQLIGAKLAPDIFSRTETDRIGQFPFAPSLCFKTRQSAKPLIKMLFYSPATKTHFHKIGFDISSI